MKRHTWVVEMKEDGEWVATGLARLIRKNARDCAQEMREGFGMKYRIVKYVPQEKAK